MLRGLFIEMTSPARKLRSCYINALELAVKYNCESLAFPLILSGIYGYPKAEALHVASVVLELSLDQTADLFERAGFAFSHSRKFDVIVEYFIQSGKYDIFEINGVLFPYDQPMLGG